MSFHKSVSFLTNLRSLSADSLNQHYASISSDSDYQPAQRKHTAPMEHLHQQFASEWQVLSLLDKLSATATGLDQLPAWFLRTGAPAFYKPITRLFNIPIESSIIPHQWKHAVICPVLKIASPHEESDYRPISIIPVLSRLLERIVVRQFLYLSHLLLHALSFTDQCAFRPTGSTTAALIAFLHSVTDLLSSL